MIVLGQWVLVKWWVTNQEEKYHPIKVLIFSHEKNSYYCLCPRLRYSFLQTYWSPEIKKRFISSGVAPVGDYFFQQFSWVCLRFPNEEDIIQIDINYKI